jgi:hypothetical protein
MDLRENTWSNPVQHGALLCFVYSTVAAIELGLQIASPILDNYNYAKRNFFLTL